jgi:hypothetical protein
VFRKMIDAAAPLSLPILMGRCPKGGRVRPLGFGD